MSDIEIKFEAPEYLQEMHRLRTDLAAERKRREALECAVEEERERWQDASGLERGGDPGGVTPEGLAKYIQSIDARAEQAERERDEYLCALGYDDETPRPPPAIVKHRINQLRRDLGAVVDERNDANDARERAEADNAALLKLLFALGVRHGCTDLSCGLCFERAQVEQGQANHPGAAWLERLRALETTMESVQNSLGDIITTCEDKSLRHLDPTDANSLRKAVRVVDAAWGGARAAYKMVSDALEPKR